ncbi:MAG: hypothetical protein WC517_02790 [Patescibacteria group bacterium]
MKINIDPETAVIQVELDRETVAAIQTWADFFQVSTEAAVKRFADRMRYDAEESLRRAQEPSAATQRASASAKYHSPMTWSSAGSSTRSYAG